MYKKLVVSVESPRTKSAFWMTFEPTLIHGPGVVVAILFMFAELLLCEEFVLMSEDFFVACTEVAHHLMVYMLYMAV